MSSLAEAPNLDAEQSAENLIHEISPAMGRVASAALLNNQLQLPPAAARFNGHGVTFPHTYRNDMLIRAGVDNLLEIPRQHSAYIASLLEGRWETINAQREGNKGPDRSFAFYRTDGKFYDQMTLSYLGTEDRDDGKKKHTAIFSYKIPGARSMQGNEFMVIAIDDIHAINYALPEVPPQ